MVERERTLLRRFSFGVAALIPYVMLRYVVGVLIGCGALACTRSAPVPAPHERPRVVIVGGGLAGLASAYQLDKHGIRYHLLEASDSWGGRVATVYYGDGLAGESGLQEIWQANPLNEIARELHVELDKGSGEAFSSVIIDGQLYVFGHVSSKEYFASFLTVSERSALEGWLRKARLLRDQARADGLRSPAVRHLQEISFADWLAEMHLPRKVSELIRLTTECELASEAQGFSALVALLEIGPVLDNQPSRHIHGGNTRLVEAMASSLRSPKTLSAVVTRIERGTGRDGRITVRVFYRKDHRVEMLEAERVVVAVPFMMLHQIQFEPALSETRWQSIGTLGRGQYTVTHLLLDKKVESLWSANDPFPILTDGPLGVIYGAQEASPSSQPLEVFSLLTYGTPAQAFHLVPREIKVREILQRLDAIWPHFSEYVRGSYVYPYHPTALPAWPPGRSPLDEQAGLLREPELGLYLAGDYTRGAHSGAAVESGIRVADRIASELE